MTTGSVEAARQFTAGIKALPPLPDVAQQIITRLSDEFVDGNLVADVVARDPAIAARLISVANSAYFGLAEPVADMREVVNRVLGVDTVRSIAIALAAKRLFDTSRCPAFDPPRFWRKSFSVGISCRRVASVVDDIEPPVRAFAYLVGLCHNLGLLTLACLEPARLSAILAGRDEDGETLDALLVDEFGTGSAAITLALAEHWRMPEPVLDAYSSRVSGDSSTPNLGIVLRAAIRACDFGAIDIEESVPGDFAVHDWPESMLPSAREQRGIEAAIAAFKR